MINLKGRDVLTTNEWTKKELDQVLDLAFKLKTMGENAKSLDILKGKTLLLFFFRLRQTNLFPIWPVSTDRR